MKIADARDIFPEKISQDKVLCKIPHNWDVGTLEGEESVLGVTESLQVRRTSTVKHDWRTAHEVPHIISLGVQVLFEELLVDESL